jgi:hypothetical protein
LFLIDESKRLTQRDIDSFFERPNWVINYYYEIGFPEQIMNHLLKDQLPSDVLNKLKLLDIDTWQNITQHTILYMFLPIGLTPRMFEVLRPYIKNDIYLKHNNVYYVLPLNSNASGIVLSKTRIGIVPKLKYTIRD